MRKSFLVLVMLPALLSCSSDGAAPSPDAAGASSTTSPGMQTTTTHAPDEPVDAEQVEAVLIDVTELTRPENIYAASAANAIASAAAASGSSDWASLQEATAAIDTIEYPEIVEGLEVLEIDEIAVRVLTTNTAASGGDWGESYVCITGSVVTASETLCTE